MAQEISFDVTTHDFGTIEKNSDAVRTYQFRFKNTGKSNLQIYKVSTGCPCVSAAFPKKAVKPGKSAYISVTYNGIHQGVGDFKKSVTVTSNTKTKYFRVFVKGKLVHPSKKVESE